MGAKLQALLEFQDIEFQIVDIRRKLEQKERLVRAQQKKIDGHKAAVEAERAEIRRMQASFDEADLDVKARSSHIAKLREHLNSVKTNKEYATVLQQINSEKADVSRVETRALEIMSAIEARNAALAEKEKAHAAEVARLDLLKQEVAHTTAAFSGRTAELEKRRAAAAARLDKESVALFERLSERFDGEATAELLRPNPRFDEFVCGGCNMNVQTDRANVLRMRDELVTCKNCGRILFIREG